MRTPRARHAVAATSIVLLGSLLVGCSSDSDEAGSGPATSKPVPSQGDAANPFAARLTGPDTAEPGDTLTETLTNEGRLPDAYQIAIDPAGAATVKEPNFHLSPGESAQVVIEVKRTPFDVHLKSVGGGNPDQVALSVS
jgi:hypothetical protein